MTRASMLRSAVTIALTTILAILHLLYAFKVSIILYQRAGGIEKSPSGWTHFGGADHAWTIPLQIPGTLLLEASNYSWPVLRPFGGLAVLVASAFTAYALSAVVVDLFARHRLSWGRFYWRAIAIVLGLAWIPIREDYALVYQYTVRF